VSTYYEMLEVPASASADEIKRAFRREIAKYHPDKVQHLGKEFQEIAAVKAAELTQAYKTLTDDALRAEYDTQLAEGIEAPVHHAPAAPPPPAEAAPRPAHAKHPPPEEEAPATAPPGKKGGTSVFKQDRAGALDLIRKATVARFRQALLSEFGRYEDVRLDGFEVASVPQSRFWTLKLPPRVLGRFVPEVTGPAVIETWSMASKMKKDSQRDLCVFLMGQSMAPRGELAAAVADARKKPMPAGGKLIMIPVNTRTWDGLVPQDAPPVVKSLLTRLKSS
jgi:curved DNA-binding protein CbpA